MLSYNGRTFEYDLNGNREKQVFAGGTTVYSYDSENRLYHVLLPDLTVVQYKYDALGRRVERSRNGGTSWERFSYDGADVVKDVRSDGVTVEYGNGLGIDDKLWQKEGTSAAKFFTVDHLGTTRGLTDASGAMVNAFSYDAFGNSATSSVTRYGFTGREADAETGLMYYRARFYDPAVGRFVSEDPIGLAGGINLYGYVKNNPLNSIDPMGLHDVDVHYYLTYYLVKNHPCYTEVEARAIANADQGVDEDPSTAPGPYPENWSSNIKYHALHGKPHGPFLNKLWPNKSLKGFGTYLHYLQDTYSHAGFTIPMIGHGLRGHTPDNTVSDPSKATRMANATWDALNRFAQQKGLCGASMTEHMHLRIAIFVKLPSGRTPEQMFFNDITSDGNHPGVFGNWTETNPAYLYRKREALGVGPR